MGIFWLHFSERETKKKILIEIIRSLDMESEEKDLSIFSMDLLDEDDFNTFFENTTAMLEKASNKNFQFQTNS